LYIAPLKFEYEFIRMKKYILLSFYCLISFAIVSCDDDTSSSQPVDDFDHESQIAIDQALLDTYFETHYYNDLDDGIWTIPDGGDQTPLSEDTNLMTIEGVEANGTVTDYTMYYYKFNGEGSDAVGKGNPSPIDSVYMNYTGMLLDSTVFDSRPEYPIWLTLSSVVRGWSHGLPKFLGGKLILEIDGVVDGDFKYEEQGEGYLFFPSGLGYANQAQGGIPANSPLVFRIALNDVNLVDHDLDLVPTKYELSFDAAGNITEYDSDGDGFSDYLDIDDDNDKVLTSEEVEVEFLVNGEIVFDFNAAGEIVAKNSVTPENPNGDLPAYKNPEIK